VSTKGRAIAQSVSRWLPTAAARVRARVWSSGICGGQYGAVAGFVSLANLHSTNCSTITLIYHLGLYNRQEVAAVPDDVSPTPQKKIVSTAILFSPFKPPIYVNNISKIQILSHAEHSYVNYTLQRTVGEFC
jgi:hypothetical protein